MDWPATATQQGPALEASAARPPALLARLLRIPPSEARFARRGFRAVDAPARQRLEQVGEVFIRGHAAALASPPSSLAGRLAFEARELRGFAYEGAAMGLALIGMLLPWRFRHFQGFRRTEGDPHRYMVHVGAGWAFAALRAPLAPFLRRLDPLLQWLAVDGIGFYHGYFHPGRTLEAARAPRRLTGYARRAFDQGLGRAAWFACGADPVAIALLVSRFPAARRHDLWSGIGLACAYAGGAPNAALRVLRETAAGHGYRDALAQGACFAAGARQRAGNPAPHTDSACGELCGMDAAAAASLTDEMLAGLPPVPTSYEHWRRRIQDRFAAQEARMG